MSKEKYKPRHRWSTATPKSEGQRLKEVHDQIGLPQTYIVYNPNKGARLVDDETGNTIVDEDGDATGQ